MEKCADPSPLRRIRGLTFGHFLLMLAGPIISLALFMVILAVMLLLSTGEADSLDFFAYLFDVSRPGVSPLPLLLSAGAAGLFLVAWCALLSWRHLRPLVKLQRSIETVIGGDYTAKLRIPSPKPWTELSERFTLMVKAFRKKIAVEAYVSKSTAQMVEGLKTGEISTAPHRQDLTIFFSDIRGFTPYTEDHDPLDVVVTVNDIFNIQVDIIVKYEGDIDKYIGDAILAVFIDPAQAFKAAWEIQKKLAAFNQAREDKLYVGIGINTGNAVVGAIGARDSLNWTVMGDVVNAAERLCSSCPGGQIYVSADAAARIKSRRPSRKESLKLKGRRNAVDVVIYGSEPGGEEEA